MTKKTKVHNRILTLCAICERDIARWENNPGWWHLDSSMIHGHIATPGDYWRDIRALTRGELEAMLNQSLANWQWERVKNYVRYREKESDVLQDSNT